MSHHGERPFDTYDPETAKRMREVMDTGKSKLSDMFRKAHIGATGEFPKGKIAPEDEGEIAFAVGHKDGKVVIDFGKPVAWLGMDRHQAIALANTILSHAKACQIIGNKSPDIRHKAKVR